MLDLYNRSRVDRDGTVGLRLRLLRNARFFHFIEKKNILRASMRLPV
jgi:hypothetical protein